MSADSLLPRSKFVIRDSRGSFYMGEDLEGHWWGPGVENAGIYSEREKAERAASALNIGMAEGGVDATCTVMELP